MLKLSLRYGGEFPHKCLSAERLLLMNVETEVFSLPNESPMCRFTLPDITLCSRN